MKKSLWYRLFKHGKMPAALDAIAAQGGVLASGEGLSVRFVSHGLRLPGRYDSASTKWHSGAIVVTADRIGLSAGRAILLDAAFVATPTALSLNRSDEGLMLHFDIASGVPGGKGTVDIRVAVDGSAVAGTRHIPVTTAEAMQLTRYA